jgi:hypothetical protein
MWCQLSQQQATPSAPLPLLHKEVHQLLTLVGLMHLLQVLERQCSTLHHSERCLVETLAILAALT